MLIGKLEQHCGNCGVIDYCGNPFGFCLCTDSRFKFVDEAEYKHIAERVPSYEDSGKQDYEPCTGINFEPSFSNCTVFEQNSTYCKTLQSA